MPWQTVKRVIYDFAVLFTISDTYNLYRLCLSHSFVAAMMNLCINISGNLGNDFLYYIRQISHIYRINGEVKNLGNGCIQIYAEGTKPNLDKLLEFCIHGLFCKRIKETNIIENEIRNYKRFTIIN